MTKKLFLFLICFNCLTLFAQKDSCVTMTYKQNQIYLLTELNKIDTFTLIGRLRKIVKFKGKDIHLIKGFELNTIIDNIDVILERNPKFSSADYKIQVIPFCTDNKQYCHIVFQAGLKNGVCYNTLIFDQMDGGDSFCYFLFDLNSNEMIYSRCNDW